MQSLTSGELAKLFHLKKYTIRHYEVQQLIKPAYIDGNGYHMYGEAEVYSMAHILLLKDLGFSLKEIKNSLENGLDHTETFPAVLARVEDEIMRLSALKRKVQNIMELRQSESHRLLAETKETRYYTYISAEYLDEYYNLNLKKLAQCKEYISHIFDEISYAVMENGSNIKVMYETNSSEADQILNEGVYYSKKIYVAQEEELEREIQLFYNELAQMDILFEERLFIHEEAYLSTFYKQSLVYSLEVKAK
ncbi:DNA-binding transcriptional regulator, MerR family [Terribacillus aidingensis]|uniref:DNA-binding transcriptional regulator, MerR family n=1 Tax=Terribacillus aidingensis TaxID=586416 RepID=A0A285P8D6_9BACI|nr:MerR family transcriptional regulator [Terribacillus aidingensis]SNZ17527.1 DNA-binding transcriptional regulator, MerR family [Terribacillus aidingensis]